MGADAGAVEVVGAVDVVDEDDEANVVIEGKWFGLRSVGGGGTGTGTGDGVMVALVEGELFTFIMFMMLGSLLAPDTCCWCTWCGTGTVATFWGRLIT